MAALRAFSKLTQAAKKAAPAPALSACLLLAAPTSHPADDQYTLLWMQRATRSSVMAGAHVFPGGKVEGPDVSLGSAQGELGTLRITAVRECLEETGQGWPVVRPGQLSHDAPITAAEVHFLTSLVTQTGPASIAPSAEAQEYFTRVAEDAPSFAPVARFRTPEAEKRKFDTAFFLQRAPVPFEGEQWSRALAEAPGIATGEVERAEHLTPLRALELHEQGLFPMPPPQYLLLHTLLGHAGTWSRLVGAEGEALLAELATVPPVQPHNVNVDKETLAVTLPGDKLHPVTRGGEGRHRLLVRLRGGGELPPGPLPPMSRVRYEWDSTLTEHPTLLRQ